MATAQAMKDGLNGAENTELSKVICKMCTLENEFGNEKCIMCDTPLV